MERGGGAETTSTFTFSYGRVAVECRSISPSSSLRVVDAWQRVGSSPLRLCYGARLLLWATVVATLDSCCSGWNRGSHHSNLLSLRLGAAESSREKLACKIS